jgi:squalene-hopene/tetraprenyl-beta-curcumene cyclase
MGLLAANDTRSESVAKGIAYILKTQKKDGSWDEPWYTGTGFPRVFYLRYHFYRIYFPLMAIARYRAAIERDLGQSAPALASRIPAQPVSMDP